MTVAMISLGVVLIVLGFIGCVVPVIPGPVLCYASLWCLLPTDKCPSVTLLTVAGVIVAVTTIADYVVPAMGAKRFDCTRWGTFGCLVGTIVGVFFFPLGLLLGPFCGAMIGELIAGRTVAASARGGIGALLGFLTGVVLKLVACAIMAFVFVRAVW